MRTSTPGEEVGEPCAGSREAGGDTVKAIVRERYGPPEEVLELRDVDVKRPDSVGS